jgi:hypothetical protein
MKGTTNEICFVSCGVFTALTGVGIVTGGEQLTPRYQNNGG